MAIPLRGAWTGNRGVLHEGREIVRPHRGNLWITCALEFRGRWREQWLPNRWTHLYFHDEAVSFAAGHRPCGECRHADYQAYRRAWTESVGGAPPSAGEMNRRLHAERLVAGTRRRRLHPMPWRDLPDGTFVLAGPTPASRHSQHTESALPAHRADPELVLGGELVTWAHHGYRGRRPRPGRGEVDVITPPATVAVLRAGYPVQIDPGATG
ncbi:hypothetical protein GCM10023321_37220 [Pseudonocardia eucalypti]|uniref:Uncharacterized protein n=1 Tax=Pseudonocardia eucalypti TaxID=648755 RepID=A0ABP9Q844_9PSEU